MGRNEATMGRKEATMGRAKPPEGGGPKPDTRHGIYIPPQCQAEEARHGTAPHDASGRRKRVDQRAADQPSEGAPAASRGVVHSAGGFVPSNNFVIPTPQILALALASHGPWGGGRRKPPPGAEGADPTHLPRSARPLRGQAGRRRSGPWGSTTHCNGAPAGHARRCHPLPPRAGGAPTCVPCRHDHQTARGAQPSPSSLDDSAKWASATDCRSSRETLRYFIHAG